MPAHQPARVGDALATGGAGRDGGLARAAQPVAHGNIGRGAVAHHHGDQERADPVRPFFHEHAVLLAHRVQATDAGTNQGAGSARVAP